MYILTNFSRIQVIIVFSNIFLASSNMINFITFGIPYDSTGRFQIWQIDLLNTVALVISIKSSTCIRCITAKASAKCSAKESVPWRCFCHIPIIFYKFWIFFNGKCIANLGSDLWFPIPVNNCRWQMIAH